MTGLKKSVGMFSGLLALAALGGCVTDDDPKNSSSFSIKADAEVTDIVEPDEDAGEPGVLSTVSMEYACVDGELEEDENEEEYLYAITGGSLYLWEDGDCSAMKFSGTSSDITGKWTSTSLSTRIPADYRPLVCEGASPEDNEYEGFLKDAVVTYTISSSEIKGNVSGTFCYAPVVTEVYESEDVSVVSSDCSTVKLKNEDVDRVATVSITFKNDKLTQSVAYNGKTCKVTAPIYLSSEPPTCVEGAEEDYEEQMEEFQECLEDSEFTEDFQPAVTKGNGNGSLLDEVEKTLKRAQPF